MVCSPARTTAGPGQALSRKRTPHRGRANPSTRGKTMGPRGRGGKNAHHWTRDSDPSKDISILAASERWGCFFFWPLGKLLGYKSEKPRAKASKKVSQ